MAVGQPYLEEPTMIDVIPNVSRETWSFLATHINIPNDSQRRYAENFQIVFITITMLSKQQSNNKKRKVRVGLSYTGFRIIERPCFLLNTMIVGQVGIY